MTELSPKSFKIIAASMVAIAVAAYINNVIVMPSLRAPDGFGHFTYIWYFAETGLVPWATEGWSFFHPPVYYAFMAGIWNTFTMLDPIFRLKLGTGIISLLGIAQAGVAYLIVKRCLPANRVAQLLAIGIMLFLPLQLFTAGHLGNERLNAVFCGTSLLALLWLLDRPHWSRAIAFGALLGVALLIKFTALVVVAGSFATIALSFYFKREVVSGLKILSIVAIALMTVCGWYYVRNIDRYGTPFKMSRDTEMVKRVENLQAEGKRDLLEFLLFDPLIITSPQWPRGGLPISGDVPRDVVRSSLRESVWTGVYANAWFEGQGGLVFPPISQSPATLRSGQIILSLATVPTAMVLIGICTVVARLWRNGWNDLYGAMLITFVAMLTLFVYGMKTVPLHGAVKAAYLTPVSVIFAFWLAIGFDVVRNFHKGIARASVVVCAALAAVCVTVFSLGAIVERDYLSDGLDTFVWQNLYGIVEYAGGNKERARELFETSASKHWHLAHENVAALALERGEPGVAIFHLSAAAKLQPDQSFGLPADLRRFNGAAKAEYAALLAVAYHRYGSLDRALRSASAAVNWNPNIPEARYNFGILQLVKSRLLLEEPSDRKALIERARNQFQSSWTVNPSFSDAISMRGVAEALLDDCESALTSFRAADAAPIDAMHIYPYQTGRGDMHSAGINRRLRIVDIPTELTPDFQRRRCTSEFELKD